MRLASDDRLRTDLAAARRARGMITDPLSLHMLNVYITELEDELYRGGESAFSGAVPSAFHVGG